MAKIAFFYETILSDRLSVLSWFKIVKLPGSLSLEGDIVWLVAIYTAVVEVEALNFIVRLACQRDELYCATDDVCLVVGITLRR